MWTQSRRRLRAGRISSLMTSALLLAGIPTIAQAQPNTPAQGKWTVELFGGGTAGSESKKGTAIDEFPFGTPFTAESGSQSRAVPSWYFGDGSTLLNEVLAEFSRIDSTPFDRILPLDPLLTTSGTTRAKAGAYGVRVGRVIVPRLVLETMLVRSHDGLELTDAMRSGIENTSRSFTAAFQGLLNTAPVTNISVGSSVAIRNRSRARTRIASTLNWTLMTGRRFSAHVTGGGGVLINSGDGPEVDVTGTYSFRTFDVLPVSETDHVRVRFQQRKNNLMGVIGGGAVYNLSARSGVRADIQMTFNSSKVTTLVTGTPTVARLTPAGVLPSTTSPAIQFSTLPGIRSSLSGAETTLTTFTGSGVSRQVSFTVGVFRRF
jgi:hypothetical protein